MTDIMEAKLAELSQVVEILTKTKDMDEASEKLQQMIPTARDMGIRVTEAGRGYATTTVPFKGNSNHVGSIYAGVQFTVAELLGGLIPLATFDTTKYFPLLKKLEITFRRMGKTDLCAKARIEEEEIERINAEVEERGKSDFYLDAVITDTEGRKVATTHGLYVLYRIRSFPAPQTPKQQ